MVKRRKTKVLSVGDVKIGGNSPISIQSMCSTKTSNIKETVEQIIVLCNAGCEIIRVAVPDIKSAKAINEIKKEIPIPLIADVHFDYKLAIESIKNRADGLRINPGNIGSKDKIKKLIKYAKEFQIPIRIGVNSGSVSYDIIKKYGKTATGLVESAMEHVKLLEDLNFTKIKISVKSSSVPLTIQAYRLLAKKNDYPFHLGVTESGTEFSGTIKSSIGIGTLISEGIGDTIRVSLTEDPVREVLVAKSILNSLDQRKGLEIISCPTCGRTEIPLITLTKEVEKRLSFYEDQDITVAVMGCAVNGPGEAEDADYGIAGGKNEGLIFKKGKIIKKVPASKLVEALLEIIEKDLYDYHI